MYMDIKTHDQTYDYKYFFKLFESWISLVDIANREYVWWAKWKKLTKEEFYKIDKLYEKWYKRPYTLSIMTNINIYRIKKFYFYNLK